MCSHLLDLHDHRRFAVTLLLTAAAQPPSDGVSQQQSSARAIRYSVRDMRAASSAAIAAYVNELGVHILVDMNGLTDGSRLGALSLLPAPVRMAFGVAEACACYHRFRWSIVSRYKCWWCVGALAV